MIPKSNTALPVLVVDDEVAVCRSLELLLNSGGVEHVISVHDGESALRCLGETPVGAVILDLSMPRLPGAELLRRIVREHPGIPVIVNTGANEVDTAVRCMSSGAFDYIVKAGDENRVLLSVHRALELRELELENSRISVRMLSGALEHPEAFAPFITQGGAMRAAFQYIEAVAPSTRPITLVGETGVGKELLARAAHAVSRRTGAYVTVNAAGLDDTLFADTLFGHIKGAFTGADANRPGLIEKAERGTLFLDEIGDLSAGSQVKLLRLLQEREYLPLGSDMPKFANAGMVVATNHDLEALVQGGKFRKDLYYRLRAHTVRIPPLRERREDIHLLLEHFLAKAAADLGKRKPTTPRELPALLMTYDFPGNVRELESLVYEAVSRHTGGVLSMATFERVIACPASGGGAARIETVETAALYQSLQRLPSLHESADLLIDEAMRRSQGNQSLASKLLGISQPSLNRRLRTRI